MIMIMINTIVSATLYLYNYLLVYCIAAVFTCSSISIVRTSNDDLAMENVHCKFYLLAYQKNGLYLFILHYHK